MPADEKKQFLTKTGKYSTHTSGIGQQSVMWGDIYDKLPDADPSKKGRTKEQFQMERLSSAKQADVMGMLTKYLQAGGDDKDVIQSMTDLVKGNLADKKAAPAGASSTNPDNVSPVKPITPPTGEVRKGYRFKGGDPSKQVNWEKV